jgi:amino-acid N-acetyltransferase
LADAVNEPHPPPIGWFRDTAPYINLHRGATFVLTVPGECAEAAYLLALAQDVALLTSLGVRLVLVYGCRPQIEAQLAAAGMDSRFHGDTRITDADAMPLLQAVVGAQTHRAGSAAVHGPAELPDAGRAAARLRRQFRHRKTHRRGGRR